MITKKDYQDALTVQDACNLSGVVHAFAEILTRMEGDTRTRNTHPISKLFADKIADLAQVRSTSDYSKAYAQCVNGAKD